MTTHEHEQATAEDRHVQEEPPELNNDNIEDDNSDFEDCEDARGKKIKKVSRKFALQRPGNNNGF